MTNIVTLPLPYQLMNGTVADATQVMGDLNYIATQVNANITGATSGMLKNLWDNPAMVIGQRGAGGSASFAGTGSRAYTLDRWQTSSANVNITTTQTFSGLLTFPYCAQIQRNNASAAVNVIQFAQSKPSVECSGYQGAVPATLSFWARAGALYSSASNNLLVQLVNGTGTDENVLAGYTFQVTPISQNVILTTSWQQYIISSPGLQTNLNEIGLIFAYTPTGTAGATDYFQVTGVQLEIGAAFSTFDQQPFALQLLRCQRMYEKSFPYGTAPLVNCGTATGALQFPATVAAANTNYSASLRFSAPKRVAPTMLAFNPLAGNFQARDVTAAADCTAATFVASDTGLAFSCTANAATAVGNRLVVHWSADADIP